MLSWAILSAANKKQLSLWDRDHITVPQVELVLLLAAIHRLAVPCRLLSGHNCRDSGRNG